MRKDNKNKKKNNLILIIVAIILIFINVVLLISYLSFNKKQKKIENNVQVNTTTANNSNNQSKEISELDKIKAMSEQKRIEYYVTKFVENLESQQYNDAYKVLNQEFKNKYFPTLQDFEKYSREKIGTTFITVNMENIERLGNNITGNIYVITSYLDDVLEHGEDYKKEQIYFVVKEKDYNQYEMSFSVRK